ncbi:MAG: ATP-grasp domain-containing protein [Reyranella sp.]|nr:ATP-grasp domain-containing protein [Reyranella sp.]
MATFAFIESNTSGTGELLVQKALAKGFDVAFLTRNPTNYPFLTEHLVHPIHVNTDAEECVLEAVRALDDVAAVFSSSDYYVRMAAAVARRLNLFGADPQSIECCRDKGRQARALHEAGVRVPATFRFADLPAAQAARAALGFPLVVKPVAGSGSVNVRLHRDERSFLPHVEQLLATKSNERGQPVEAGGLVQAFVEGAEFSVEAIGFGNRIETLGVTKKYLGEPPTFLEVGHDFPAGIPSHVERQLCEHARLSLEAVNLRSGPSHIELRLGADGPNTIEINPRLAGGMIPVIMAHALGMDVLGLLIDLYAGGSPGVTRQHVRASSIGFFVPKSAGILEQVVRPEDSHPAVLDVRVTKAPGDSLVRDGDFRDRIGHVITEGETPAESRAAVDSYMADCDVVVRTCAQPSLASVEATGRVRQSLHPEALGIVSAHAEPQSRRQTFAMLAAIDEAHLLMLHARGVLDRSRVRPLLHCIQELKRGGFSRLLRASEPRGPYMLYESALIDELGAETGGAAHVGRSRNDINATMFRMNLRETLVATAKSTWRLRSALLQMAARSTEIAMPVYSQFQAGSPGTMAAYLLAVEQALARDFMAMQDVLAALEVCPLGACAGGGTSIAIDPEHVARLLGFGSSCRSALDAVASRDLGLRAVAAVAIAGTTITRLAQDYQLWTTLEFGFLDLPDDLVGGSSNMPQKRNPYLLEIIKGRAIRPSGHLSTMVTGVHKVPFSNSVEVGSEAMAELPDALRSYREAAVLMSLVVARAKARPQSMLRSGQDGMVVAIGVAEVLARDFGLAFRVAHHKVGETINRALKEGRDPPEAVQALLPPDCCGYQLLDWARAFDYGGGPGRATTARNLTFATQQLAHDGAHLRVRVAGWHAADELRAREIQAVLTNDTR